MNPIRSMVKIRKYDNNGIRTHIYDTREQEHNKIACPARQQGLGKHLVWYDMTCINPCICLGHTLQKMRKSSIVGLVFQNIACKDRHLSAATCEPKAHDGEGFRECTALPAKFARERHVGAISIDQIARM